MREQVQILKNNANTPDELPGVSPAGLYGVTVYNHSARAKPSKPGDNSDQGCFSGTGSSGNGKNLTSAEMKTDTIKHFDLVVAFLNRPDREQ
jgi:hypothetical protein